MLEPGHRDFGRSEEPGEVRHELLRVPGFDDREDVVVVSKIKNGTTD